jgi:hypothetical protein
LERVEGLRRAKVRLESALYAIESRTPQRLRQALDGYGAILAREVIDTPPPRQARRRGPWSPAPVPLPLFR